MYCKGYGATRNDHHEHAGINGDCSGSHDHKTTYFESKIPIPRESDRDVS
jgi:hypothetical protein